MAAKVEVSRRNSTKFIILATICLLLLQLLLVLLESPLAARPKYASASPVGTPNESPQPAKPPPNHQKQHKQHEQHEQHEQQASGRARRARRAATARLDRLWDDAVIPYEIDPVFSSDRAALFRSAMRHWENYTCIKFIERQPEEHRNYIVFTERSCGCCSFVGKRGNGAQAISIGKHCDKFGIVVHELGHVVGFWHEHTRPDRDQHVQIIGKNIMSGQEYNFNKLTKDEVNSLGLAYDYDSILHYATNTFAKDTYLDTILPLHGHLNTEVATSQPPAAAAAKSEVHAANATTSATSTTTTTLTTAAAKSATMTTATTQLLPGGKSTNMINDQPAAAASHSTGGSGETKNESIARILDQIESDFRSMLEFEPTAAKTTTRRQMSKMQKPRMMLLDGGVVVSLSSDKDNGGVLARSQLKDKRSKAKRSARVDVDDGEHMLAMDNLLAKTRPEIGQRVRLSVGDIAQTNLLYKCPKCGKTIQKTSGWFQAPNYFLQPPQQSESGKIRANANEQAKITTTTTSVVNATTRGADTSHSTSTSGEAAKSSRLEKEFCEWRLSVGFGERISINITDLDLALPSTEPMRSDESANGERAFGMPRGALAEHEMIDDLPQQQPPAAIQDSGPLIMGNCLTDYLEIRDGYTYRAPVLAKLCGHISSLRGLLRPLVSTSNRVLVSLRTTSASAGRRGFLAQHETVCGGYIMLGNAFYNEPLVQLTPQSHLTTTTSHISSTTTTDHRSAQTISSTSHRFQTTSEPSTTQTSPMNSKTTSNANISPSSSSSSRSSTTASTSDNEVLLSSQTNARYTSNNLQSHQQPSSSSSGTNENLSALDSISTSRQILNNTQPATATTAIPTQAATTATIGNEKAHDWSQWPPLNSSFIQSPNWPENYRPSKECLWLVKADENHQVSLRFDTFDLESHDQCAYDFVEVRDGETETSDLIGRFCGNRIPEQILSSSQSMLIKFVSDSDVNRAGFFASLQAELDECKLGTHGCSFKCSNAAVPYRCECPNSLELAPDGKSCVPTCGGIRNDSKGQITSPAFPDLYPLSTRCVWEIYAPAHHRISLNFTHFDLEGVKSQECDYDFVDIRSRISEGKYIKSGIFCGPNPAFMVTSVANVMRIEFQSDNSIQKSGFLANYFIDRDECATNNGGCQHICSNTIGSYQCSCNNGFVLHENKHDCLEGPCTYSISTPDGNFHSPNFPAHYQPNKECAWVFTTAPGHRIKLIFDQFDLEGQQECAYDVVAIYDGESTEDSALGRFCGSKKPLTLVSSFNALYLLFKSDATNEKRGFNATHTTVCGGRLQANLNHNDLIYSHPLFDGVAHYNRNEDCEWLIEANYNQRVKIEFTFFALEPDVNCNYDQTIVYDGSDDTATQLARLCGTEISKEQTKFTSSGESMLIIFRSDDSINNKGFSLTYTAIEMGTSQEDEPIPIPYPTAGSQLATKYIHSAP